MEEATNDCTVVPDTRKCLLLASERGNPLMVALYLVPEPARDFFSRRCFTNRWCTFLALVTSEKDGVASENGRQLVPAHVLPQREGINLLLK